jgi:RNA polymerase sigma-70 factor (ECF subfamily)
MFTDELEAILPEIRAYARMLCSNRDLADDIVQNACLKAWRARKSFDPKRGKFRAWMFTITRNEFLQIMRKQRPVDYYEPAAFEHKLVQECQLDSRADCSDAIQALFKLSADQRDVFILVLAAGYSYEEAATICNCSVGTIKSRISRARTKLTELLAAHDAGAAQPAEQPIRFRGLDDIFGRVEALLKRAA